MTKVEQLINEGASIEAIVAAAVQAERESFLAICDKAEKEAWLKYKTSCKKEGDSSAFDYYNAYAKAAFDLAALIK